jgi:PKD repeat protein
MLNVNDGKGKFSLPTVRQFDYIDQEFDYWYGSCVDDLNGDKYPEIVHCGDGQVRIHQTFLRTKAVAHPVYAEVPVGKAIQFDASSTRFPWGLKAKSYAWQFGDKKNGTGQKVSHTYARRGTYTVKLSVTDNAGRKDEDRITVIVK